jgi:hypothetical protein
MARGWESKSVEEQQAEAISSRRKSKPSLTLKEIAMQQKKQTLQLSRNYLRQQLEAARNPRHRLQLEAALADLDARLAHLG